MVLSTPRCIHVSYSECDVQWGKVSNKEEVDITRLEPTSVTGKCSDLSAAPLGSPGFGSGRKKMGLLSAQRIHHPALLSGPIKFWCHSSALLYFSSCRNVLLIKSPLVEQTDSSPIAMGHTSEIHNQQTPSTQIIPRSCKLRAMSVTGKRQTPGVQSAKSPGSYPANTVQLRTELHLPRHVWAIYFLRTWPHMGTNNSLEFGEKGDFRERYIDPVIQRYQLRDIKALVDDRDILTLNYSLFNFIIKNIYL